MFRIKPKEEKFFQYFSEHSAVMLCAADLMRQAFDEPERLKEILEKLDKAEREADEVVDKMVKKLHKTFITPFDREDIFVLVQKLDDLVDCMKETIDKMYMYNVGPASKEVRQLAVLICDSAQQLDKAVSCLGSLKKQHLKIEARCRRVLDLEAEGDVIYRQEMAKLFRECKDPIEIIKWKEICTDLENALDTCEDITDSLKKVVLKYA